MKTYSRKMKSVCDKNLDVFDFKDETQSPSVALRITNKLKNSRSAAIEKYTFLATAASGEDFSAEKLKYVPSLDIDAINNVTHMATTLIEESTPVMVADSNDPSTVPKQTHPHSTPQSKTERSESEVDVTATSASPSYKLKSAIQDLLPEFVSSNELSSKSKSDEVVAMDSDENESERSSSSCDVGQDDDVIAGTSSDQCEEMTAVVLCPDYVVYCDCYYTDSVISFTSNFVKLEASTTDGDDRISKYKWEIKDIQHIRSSWHEQVEMAMVVIHLLTKDTENVESISELKFAAIGSECYGKLEAIASLNATYKTLWTSILESEDIVLGHNEKPSSNYLPIFSRPSEEVVYPKGDADAVCISKRDFDLLQPDTFVNDTIIDFYIKYLKNRIKPEERQRFHFFNSFFFRKLADPDKDPLDASRGRAAFQRVKKWTRKVSLFEKDYVFIPVNYNYHWSLIVICHLGDVATYKDEDVNESMKVPCVLHMDSIRGSHTGLKGLLQSYLKEEWKERNQEGASEDICLRFDNLRFIYLEVSKFNVLIRTKLEVQPYNWLPQQQNLFDCGLFLLHYVELFLEEAPLHFNPFKTTNSSNFLNVDWFPPADASLKRVVIQKLICDLLENPNLEEESSSIHKQCHLSGPTTNVPQDGPCKNLNPSFESESFVGTQLPENFNQTITFDDDFKGPLIQIQEEDVEGGGAFAVHYQKESAIQQQEDNNGIIMGNASSLVTHDIVTRNVPENNSFLSIPETSTSGCENSVEIIDEVDSDEPKDHAQMLHGNDDDGKSCMEMIPPPDMMMQASEKLSDVESPAKKIRRSMKEVGIKALSV